jgi:hypothetical protein
MLRIDRADRFVEQQVDRARRFVADDFERGVVEGIVERSADDAVVLGVLRQRVQRVEPAVPEGLAERVGRQQAGIIGRRRAVVGSDRIGLVVVVRTRAAGIRRVDLSVIVVVDAVRTRRRRDGIGLIVVVRAAASRIGGVDLAIAVVVDAVRTRRRRDGIGLIGGVWQSGSSPSTRPSPSLSMPSLQFPNSGPSWQFGFLLPGSPGTGFLHPGGLS